MKLRNKKTGEIKEVQPITIGGYRSLAELNEEWEDYDEPETIWYITAWGDVKEYSQDQFAIKQKQAIGNYFETEEEAEKAVEKLKAWKRLKDKGLIFCGWKITDDGCSVDIETTLDAEVVRAQQKNITDDLNLLFGDEE